MDEQDDVSELWDGIERRRSTAVSERAKTWAQVFNTILSLGLGVGVAIAVNLLVDIQQDIGRLTEHAANMDHAQSQQNIQIRQNSKDIGLLASAVSRLQTEETDTKQTMSALLGRMQTDEEQERHDAERAK